MLKTKTMREWFNVWGLNPKNCSVEGVPIIDHFYGKLESSEEWSESVARTRLMEACFTAGWKSAYKRVGENILSTLGIR
jgi:hypothetical protein